MMRPQLVIEKGEVAVRLAEQKFHYHRDGPKGKGIVNIPKNLLNGFRLSEIPRDTYIHPNFTSIDIWLPSFAEGSALVLATAEWNRSSWDGDVRLTHYMEAFRQAILERKDAEEFESHEHGDSIFLHYDITISEDLEIQEAINRVENIVTAIEKRADQLAHRRSDPLTGLFDRGSFDADLTHAQEYSKADSLSLLVIDLDKFKTINDTYGHEAGDEVLKKAAGVVRLACEGKGSCYRYGGDEVIVLLPNHNFQQATAVAEQIRVSVAELKFEKSAENITASIGLTSYPEVTKASDDIISDADAMVYQAKDDGGNAVRGAMASEMKQDSARTMRLDIASRVEAVELWMQLRQGSGDYYSVYITNDSDEDVTVEAITLRMGKVYLSEPSKPLDLNNWKIPKRSSGILNWTAKTPPTHRLRWIVPEPGVGQIIEIDIVVWGRVLGRRRTFSHTILASYSGNTITEWG